MTSLDIQGNFVNDEPIHEWSPYEPIHEQDLCECVSPFILSTLLIMNPFMNGSSASSARLAIKEDKCTQTMFVLTLLDLRGDFISDELIRE